MPRLQLNSSPGDWIGQGQTVDLTYNLPGDSISAHVRRSVPAGPAELLFILDSPLAGNQFAMLFFGTNALGIPIQPGVYTNARRSPFAPAGHPGLDVSFQNRGSNQVFGSFTIWDVTFSTGNVISTFDASFEQRSESATAPALLGRFTYNAAGLGATTVPDGTHTALLLLGGIIPTALLGIRRPSASRREIPSH